MKYFLLLLSLCILLSAGLAKPAEDTEAVSEADTSRKRLLPTIGNAIKNVLGYGASKRPPGRLTTSTTPLPVYEEEINSNDELGVTTRKPMANDTCLTKRCADIIKEATFKSEVCASNNQTYQNIVILRCYRNRCNRTINFGKWGGCNEVRKTPTTDSTIRVTKDIGKNNNNGESTGTLDSNCFSTCPKTNSYQPVCGSDGSRYDNMSHLDCANKCGKKIKMMRQGGC